VWEENLRVRRKFPTNVIFVASMAAIFSALPSDNTNKGTADAAAV
jgi:hypothetical protein